MDEITFLAILTLVITGTVAMVAVVDVTMGMEILATVIADTMIGTREDEMEEIEVAEVAEDVEEEMEIGHKVTIHAQFMGGTNRRTNVSLIPMGIITGHGMAILLMEIAKVEETAQGEATPTIPIMNQMVAILVEVKGMAPTTTPQTILTTVIVEVVATILTIKTMATVIIWLISVCLIGIRND
jgi:hypothetical protein